MMRTLLTLGGVLVAPNPDRASPGIVRFQKTNHHK
jgi:hypothetical protein